MMRIPPLYFLLIQQTVSVDTCNDIWPPENGACKLNCGATVLNAKAASTATAKDGECQVAFASIDDLADYGNGTQLQGVDHIVTDSLYHAPFMGRRGKYHFFDHNSAVVLPDLDQVLEQKTNLISVLLPKKYDDFSKITDPLEQQIIAQALQVLGPDHVYVDHGDITNYINAMGSYRFTLIFEESFGKINPAVNHAFLLHTTPIMAGFNMMSTYFYNAVIPFEKWAGREFDENVTIWNKNEKRNVTVLKTKVERENTTFYDIHHHVQTLNAQTGILWNNQRILQDIIHYRYAHPWPYRFYNEVPNLKKLRNDCKKIELN